MTRRALTRRALTQTSFDQKSFDKRSFEEQSFAKQSFTNQSFDKQSFDKKSFDKQNFDKESLDRQSFHKKSFDKTSFKEKSLAKTSFQQQLWQLLTRILTSELWSLQSQPCTSELSSLRAHLCLRKKLLPWWQQLSDQLLPRGSAKKSFRTPATLVAQVACPETSVLALKLSIKGVKCTEWVAFEMAPRRAPPESPFLGPKNGVSQISPFGAECTRIARVSAAVAAILTAPPQNRDFGGPNMHDFLAIKNFSANGDFLCD